MQKMTLMMLKILVEENAVWILEDISKAFLFLMKNERKFLFHPLSWLTLGRILERGKKGESDDNDEE
uniref:Reverse transcriptase domain-containing protein n=1 Tax=Romanomermis culicivorax TaxID=13658 RepID=A0A915J6U5_ROMCU